MEIELFLAQFTGAVWAEGEANVQERHPGRKVRHGRAVGRWLGNSIIAVWTLGSCRAGMLLPLACAVCCLSSACWRWSTAERGSAAVHGCTAAVTQLCSSSRQAWLQPWVGLEIPLPSLTSQGCVVGWAVGDLLTSSMNLSCGNGYFGIWRIYFQLFSACCDCSVITLWGNDCLSWTGIFFDNWRSKSTLFHDNAGYNQTHILGSRWYISNETFSHYLLHGAMYWKHREWLYWSRD